MQEINYEVKINQLLALIFTKLYIYVYIWILNRN